VTPQTLQRDPDIAGLLRRLVSAEPGEQPDLEAVDYDWRVPCRFMTEELARLNAFAAGVAESISRKLRPLLRAELDLAASPVTQHYAPALKADLAEASDYGVALTCGDTRAAGVVLLEATRAREWVSKILGGAGDDSADRELSTVEQELMLDVAAVLAEALSAASTQAGGPAFSHAGSLASGASALPGDEALEYCRLSFAPEGFEGRPDISVVIFSDLAESVVGGSGADETKAAGVDAEREILAHLAQMIVTATAPLGRTDVTVRDLLRLEPGDVLLVDTRVGEPIPLQVDGRAVTSGLPVRSSGKYALMITSQPAGHAASAPDASA
jgi:flagellar motor switch protein FliM